MARAMFVSLTRLYLQLDKVTGLSQDSDALRNCTCALWKVNPANAGDIRYAFGVWQGGVVSAYAVQVPVRDWPVMPRPAAGEARRYIPVSKLSAHDWACATKWTKIPMFGPLRYGEVHLDSQGQLDRFEIPPAPEHPEEKDDEQSG